MQNANKAAVVSRQVLVNKIKTKKQCKNTNKGTLYIEAERHSNEIVQSPLRKDDAMLMLPELKVVIQRDFYVDTMKTFTGDFITVEYEEGKKKDDFPKNKQKRKRIISEPSKSDIISSDIEFYEKENFKNKILKSFVKLKGSAKTNTGKLETQSKNIQRRRRNISATSHKVSTEELTNVGKMPESPIHRRKNYLHSSEDSAELDLHKSKRESLRNSIPATKSSGRWQRAENAITKEQSIQTRKKSTTIDLEIEEEDDPYKLWCICRQPYNNRFMIMCDYCKDWFHGNCVGISKQKGRQLEKLEQEWICPNCEKKGKKMPRATKRKRKPSSLDAMIVCKKEISINLERLSDSVIVEMTTHYPAPQPQQGLEGNAETLNTDALPPEIILKIFDYLDQNQLGQIARTCKRWNALAHSPTLWKKLDVKLYNCHESQTKAVKIVTHNLSGSVTYIRFDFRNLKFWTEPLFIEEISMILHKQFPHLQTLIVHHANLSGNLSSFIDICTHRLPKVKKLVVTYSRFPNCHSKRKCSCPSAIEVLDLSGCDLGVYNMISFARMPQLKQLFLSHATVGDAWFLGDFSLQNTTFLKQLHVLDLGYTMIGPGTFYAISAHAFNLEELYLCNNIYLGDNCFKLDKPALPHLKTICLAYCIDVTCQGVVSLIKSFSSLQHVYVSEAVAQSFATHRFVAKNRCKANIVKTVNGECRQSHKIN